MSELIHFTIMYHSYSSLFIQIADISTEWWIQLIWHSTIFKNGESSCSILIEIIIILFTHDKNVSIITLQ